MIDAIKNLFTRPVAVVTAPITKRPIHYSVLYHFWCSFIGGMALFHYNLLHQHVLSNLDKHINPQSSKHLATFCGPMFHRFAWFMTYYFAQKQSPSFVSFRYIMSSNYMKFMTFIAFIQLTENLMVDLVEMGHVKDMGIITSIGNAIPGQSGGNRRHTMYFLVWLTNCIAVLYLCLGRMRIIQFTGMKTMQ